MRRRFKMKPPQDKVGTCGALAPPVPIRPFGGDLLPAGREISPWMPTCPAVGRAGRGYESGPRRGPVSHDLGALRLLEVLPHLRGPEAAVATEGPDGGDLP